MHVVGNVHHCFLHLDVYSLKTVPLHRLILLRLANPALDQAVYHKPCLLVALYAVSPPLCSTLYIINRLQFFYPRPPNSRFLFVIHLSFLHSIASPIQVHVPGEPLQRHSSCESVGRVFLDSRVPRSPLDLWVGMGHKPPELRTSCLTSFFFETGSLLWSLSCPQTCYVAKLTSIHHPPASASALKLQE